jgi:hypothetical protein
MIDWLVATGIFVGLVLPAVVVVGVGLRRGWPFSRIGSYLVVYVAGVSLFLMAGLGIRGWMLGLGVLASTATAAVAFLLYSHVLAMGEEARRRRDSSR